MGQRRVSGGVPSSPSGAAQPALLLPPPGRKKMGHADAVRLLSAAFMRYFHRRLEKHRNGRTAATCDVEAPLEDAGRSYTTTTTRSTIDLL
eukprot:scaffold5843_cov125-Isochrysis_galbana.AAC.3